MANPFQNAEDAFTAANRSGLPGPYEGQQDAYRHALWMAKISGDTKKALGDGAVGTALGPIAAQILGFTHEGINFPIDAARHGLFEAAQSSLMDLNNNAHGARMGVEGGNVEQRVLDAARAAQHKPRGALESGLVYRAKGDEAVAPTYRPTVDLFADEFDPFRDLTR